MVLGLWSPVYHSISCPDTVSTLLKIQLSVIENSLMLKTPVPGGWDIAFQFFHVIKQSEVASVEKCRKSTINCMGFGVCMFVLPSVSLEVQETKVYCFVQTKRFIKSIPKYLFFSLLSKIILGKIRVCFFQCYFGSQTYQDVCLLSDKIVMGLFLKSPKIEKMAYESLKNSFIVQ